MKQKKPYDIWCEGFRATGQSRKAWFVGSVVGVDFKDACRNYSKAHPEANIKEWGTNAIGIWGCQFFPTEEEARKSFG